MIVRIIVENAREGSSRNGYCKVSHAGGRMIGLSVLSNFVHRLNRKPIKRFESWILFSSSGKRPRPKASSSRRSNIQAFCPHSLFSTMKKAETRFRNVAT
jgi:hypothetical protein